MLRGALKVLLVLAVTVGLVLLVGADPSTVRLESARPAETADFVDYMAVVTASPSTAGDRYQVLVNGDRIFPAMLDAIRGARQRVNFFTYIYEPGQAADMFAEAFAAAARRGVAVTIVVDAFGASGLPADYIARLEDAGCTVEQFRPFRWYSLQETNYRNHRKLLVVDGRTAFIGGAGIADHWLGDAQDPEHWRDTQFRVDGPAVGYLEAAFYEALAETQRRVTPEVTPRDDAPLDSDHTAQSVVVTSAPGARSGGIKRLFLMSLAAARRTVDITSPYFIVDDSTEWAIEEARRRGVAIRILVEGDTTDAKPVKWASRADYDNLLRRGIEIFEYQPTMMHSKTIVVDGSWSVVGSANFDNRSLDMNDELSVGIQSRDIAATLTSLFEQDLQRSRHLTLEVWRQRSVLTKGNERFWTLFGELF
jgi:cardiolipin synthase